MINLLVGYTLAVSCACLLLMVFHKGLLNLLGAKNLYNQWLVIPLIAALAIASPWLAPMLQALFTGLGISGLPSFATMIGYANNDSAAAVSVTDSSWSTLVTVWLCGALAMLALAIAEAWLLSRRDSAHLGRLRLQRNKSITTPGIFGWLTPTIQLPKHFSRSYTAEERRLILRHELMHWRRGDTRINLMAWLLLCSQWFNPLIWLSYRRFRADQELACDADVLTQCTHDCSSSCISAYAEALLKTTIHSSRDKGLVHLGLCSTHYGYHQGRVTMIKERLMQLQQRRTVRRAPVVVSGLLVCSLAVIWQLPAHSESDQASAADNEKPLIPNLRVEPRYPQQAVEQGIEGYVDLSFVINDEGKPSQIKVLHSQPEGVFDEAVIAALERWRYQPQDNKPMQVRMQMKLGKD